GNYWLMGKRGASYTPANNLLFSYYNGSTWAEALDITSTGAVGIGTATPAQLLDVRGNARVLAGGNGQGLFGQDASNNYLFSLTRQTTYLRLKSYAVLGWPPNQPGGPSTVYNLYFTATGSVGVATTTPTGVFSVSAPSSTANDTVYGIY